MRDLTYVFVGPTLPTAEVAKLVPDATVVGPVAFGDVYRAVTAGARSLLIIDGYFERVPAVWHKEILWAMSEGVNVFGVSSMGALRAAELADFGMRGVGRIFEWFRSGTLEDDDEVTIAHASSDNGYAALSEAMVNIRATLARAVERQVVSANTAELVVRVAKERFYAERTFSTALDDAEQRGASAEELRILRAWIPVGRVDQKADDARQALRVLADWLQNSPKPMRVGYRFEATDAWLEATRVAGAQDAEALGGRSRGRERLEEELKLDGVYVEARNGASVRAAAIEHARRSGFRPDVVAVSHAAEVLRNELGLLSGDSFAQWREQEQISDAKLVEFFEDQARVLAAKPWLDTAAAKYLDDHLRVSGRYNAYTTKARSKAEVLANFGPRAPTLSEMRVSEAGLWLWYFNERLGKKVPDDLHHYARVAGFADLDEMRAATLRELQYARARPPGSG